MIFLFGIYVILMDVVSFYVTFWKYIDNFCSELGLSY